jgi:hypothetical protein
MKYYLHALGFVFGMVIVSIFIVAVSIGIFNPKDNKSPNISNAEKLCRDNLKLDVKSVSVFKNRIIIICEDGENE